MNVQVAFGKQGLSLELPDGPGYHVVKVHSAPPLPDVEKALGAALDAPVAGLPLIELARGKKPRPSRFAILRDPLPTQLRCLRCWNGCIAPAFAPENVTICIATGLHRGATEDELRTILGAKIAATYDIANHDAKDRELHRFVGTTQQETPVYIDERFMAADLHITLGFIEQHLMLGFSGGRKLVAPGLAAQETIKVIHSPRFMREKRATEGSIRDNPLHAELLEVARMARHDFMLDVTLDERAGNFWRICGRTGSGARRWRGISAELLGGISAGAGGCGHYYGGRISAGLDLLSDHQGHHRGAAHFEAGRNILILSECAEGVGSPRVCCDDAPISRSAGVSGCN